MLNEERIILMTKMAAYEAHEGKKNMSIGKYFRSDYIAIQVMKSVISATIAFAIGFALFIFYDFEMFMQDIYKMDLIVFARNVLIYYAVAVVGYGGISYVICSYRYAKAKKSLKRYSHNLKKLNSLYDE
ncbi:MAG: hypothetical protein NC251_12730 [Lachnoclostridium sp.]|nr:hypothetical protein [Lachnospira sp.]MCM1249279.1 hypothetical protein [Lachnoclostridium sp.]MCM1465373.1 hypothetical protein [Bacteroidales bacterium]MCM1535453.1 hypothetical protein [Clostridium sp.]MCM1326801.1 hypothetical protein [Lachnoclostridium sp.]